MIFICAGDFRQILPVVKQGNREDVIAACISSSVHWQDFDIYHLTVNMRLMQLDGNDAHLQRTYADAILAIGEGRDHEYAPELYRNEELENMKVGFPMMKYFIAGENDLDAIDWLYPNGFRPDEMQRKCILASTNDSVDNWNSIVQSLNNNEMWTLYSNNRICDVDDPHGFLARCLSEYVLNKYNANGVPRHILHLKVDDICIVVRCIKGLDLATNTRVKVIHISNQLIRCRVLDGSERIVLIPRIRFRFKLEYGESYYMMRTQFPLRLAYCMTYNKSQSQTYDHVLLDVTGEPFEHGHLYVASSRITKYSNIRCYIHREQLHANSLNPFNHEDMPVVTNIVYSNVLRNR